MIKECFDKCKGSGGLTSVEDMLFFEKIDLKESCMWYTEDGKNKDGHNVTYIVMGVAKKTK